MAVEYSIWVLEYAYIPEVPVSSFIYGAHNAGTWRMPFAYVLLVGGGQVAMVDVGFDTGVAKAKIIEGSGMTGWCPPRDVLAEVGLTPGDVQTVLVTHAHFDHFGNLGDFPNAVFYLQEREFTKWVAAMALPPRLQLFNSLVDDSDLMGALRLAADGRLVLVDGPKQDVLPGIDVYPAFDTHTYGSMYVTVEDGRGPGRLVFAGDNVYTWDQLPGMAADGKVHPPGLAMNNLESMLVCDEMLKAVDEDPFRVIPVHEPKLREKYPTRVSGAGLAVTEIRLATGATSRV